MPKKQRKGVDPSLPPPQPRASVLAVLGDVDGLALVRLVLERAGHEVLTAATAAAAERLLDGRRIDLAIAATTLADADGVAFVRALGQRLGCRTVTVGRIGQEDEARRSERAGVDRHIMGHALAAGLGGVIATLFDPPGGR
jgi:DNA-binding response OmpR family regulator